MDRIKGQIVDILGSDSLLLEIKFVGNYNRTGYADIVKVYFTELIPPYLKNANTEQVIHILQKRVLGETASVQVQRRISENEVSGRLQLEGAKFRAKRKTRA